MNHLPSGEIAIGAPGSIVRFESSKYVCRECIFRYKKESTLMRRITKEVHIGPAAYGVCDCCVENKAVHLLEFIDDNN